MFFFSFPFFCRFDECCWYSRIAYTTINTVRRRPLLEPADHYKTKNNNCGASFRQRPRVLSKYTTFGRDTQEQQAVQIGRASGGGDGAVEMDKKRKETKRCT